MYETVKKIIVRVAVCALVFAIGFAAGVRYAYGSTSLSDTERTRKYEAGSALAEELAERAGGELDDAREQMHGVGSRIDGSLTVVGEVRAIGDTIAKNSADAQGAVGSIEQGISRIGKIISDAEKARAGAYGNDSDRREYSGH